MDRLKALQEELSEQHKGIQIHTLSLDVRKKQNIDEAISNLPQKDQIDVLVNNAGLVIGVDHLVNVSEDAFDTMFETNVKGLVFLTQALLPGMKANQRGHIINIGSVAGKQSVCFVKVIFSYFDRKTKLSWRKYLLCYKTCSRRHHKGASL